MTLSIICSFITCWTPYFLVHLIHIWSEYTLVPPESIVALAENLALFNSALNPILYGFYNIQLKHGLAEVCCPIKTRDNERKSRTFMLNGGLIGGREVVRVTDDFKSSPQEC